MAFRTLKQFKLAVDGGATAETAVSLAITGAPTDVGGGLQRQAVIYAKTTDIVVKFGDDSVVADATLTSLAMPAGNFNVPAGAVMLITIPGGATHFSAIAEDESTTSGKLFLALGHGENI